MKSHTHFLKSIGSCPEAIEWFEKQPSPEQAWATCKNPWWMIWLLRCTPFDDHKVFRLFACWCVRNTPIGDGRTVWDLLDDDRSRAAVNTAERFASGKATAEELAAAHRAAGDVVAQDKSTYADHRNCAARAAWEAASPNQSDHFAQEDNALEAANVVSKGAAWDAATAAQADQLRKLVPFCMISKWIKAHRKWRDILAAVKAPIPGFDGN